jgi:hypothetical protein
VLRFIVILICLGCTTSIRAQSVQLPDAPKTTASLLVARTSVSDSSSSANLTGPSDLTFSLDLVQTSQSTPDTNHGDHARSRLHFIREFYPDIAAHTSASTARKQPDLPRKTLLPFLSRSAFRSGSHQLFRKGYFNAGRSERQKSGDSIFVASGSSRRHCVEFS